MRAPRLPGRLLTFPVFLALLLAPAVAAAQTPVPGETPELSRPWTYWLAIPVALGAAGLLLLVGLSYVLVSRRFYGKEEPPKPAPARQYAGINAPAYPAPVTASPAPVAPQAEAPAAAPAASAPQVPAAAPSPATAPPEPATPAKEPAAAEPETERAASAEEPAAVEPAAAKSAERAEAQPDEDVYQRVLQEQLDKGVSPRVAEGRAKAAALRAGRQKAGAGER